MCWVGFTIVFEFVNQCLSHLCFCGSILAFAEMLGEEWMLSFCFLLVEGEVVAFYGEAKNIFDIIRSYFFHHSPELEFLGVTLIVLEDQL